MKLISGLCGGEARADFHWFGQLPEDWQTAPLRFLASFISGGTPDKGNADYWGGDIPWVSPKDMKRDEIEDAQDHISRTALDETGLHIIPVGSVLIVVRGMILAHTLPVAITTRPVTINQDIKAVCCGPSLFPRYLQVFLQGAAHWLLSHADESSHGTKKVDTEILGRTEIPCPSLNEQCAISDFLNREVEQLDSLVAEKERLLRLLAEKRRALITRAVIRGLDARVALRDSGVPLLGEIPAHWCATRLKFVAEVRGGLTLGKNYGSAATSEFPYLRVANVQDGHLDLSDITTVMIPAGEAETYMLKTGDVLMNEGGDADKLGRGCIWREEIAPCLHQNHVFAVRPRSIRSEWLNIWTSTDAAKAFFEARAKQSTNLASISATNIKELPIPVPPENEQESIIDYIVEKTSQIDALWRTTERTISLLKERRTAVITEAVTGNVDIGIVE